jgi:hypothetical protein
MRRNSRSGEKWKSLSALLRRQKTSRARAKALPKKIHVDEKRRPMFAHFKKVSEVDGGERLKGRLEGVECVGWPKEKCSQDSARSKEAVEGKGKTKWKWEAKGGGQSPTSMHLAKSQAPQRKPQEAKRKAFLDYTMRLGSCKSNALPVEESMPNTRLPYVFWDFCRTTHVDGSVFSHQVPLLRWTEGPSTRVSRLLIDSYHVSMTGGGLVLHEWGEVMHMDPISTWRDGESKGTEVAIYDTKLHTAPYWRVGLWEGGVCQVVKVAVPASPDVDQTLSFFEKAEVEEGHCVFSVSSRKRGMWEWVRQKINPRGVYQEAREWVASGVKKSVKIDASMVYDAVLITRDGWEEKFILKGSMEEVKKCPR